MAQADGHDASKATASGQQATEDASAIAPATTSPQSLPLETKESLWLRRASMLSFWAVVVFLGLPIWLKTTAVYRAELPLQEMTAWAEGQVSDLHAALHYLY